MFKNWAVLRFLSVHQNAMKSSRQSSAMDALYQGQVGTVITYLPPTSETFGSNPRPYMGKFVDAYQWLAVCSTEP